MSLIYKIITCLLFIVSYNSTLGQNNNYDSTISDIEYIKSKEYKCYNKGYNAASKGKYRRAVKFFSCAIKESHKKYSPLALRVSYYKDRGKSYSYLLKRKKAIKDYLMCLSLDSTNESIISLLAREYYYVMEYEKAIQYFSQLSKTKDSSYNISFAISSYYHLKEYDSAITLSKIFLEKHKDSIIYSSYVSDIYFELFDYENAIKNYERLKDSSNDVTPYYFDDEYRVDINKKLAMSYTRLAVEDFKNIRDTSKFICYLYQATLNHEPTFLDDEELRQLARLLFSMKKWEYSYYYYSYINEHNYSDYVDIIKIGNVTSIKSKLIKKSIRKISRRWK